MMDEQHSSEAEAVDYSNGEGGTKQSSNYQLLSVAGEHSAVNRINKYVWACALFASLNSILLGYDIGVMSGAVLFIKEELHIRELQEEVLMGSLNLVSLVGGILAGRLSDAIGRKLTMAVASIIFLVGAAVMALAPSFVVLLLGRLVSGIGVGFGLMIAPVYTAELAPSATRGALVSFPELFINVGILLGYIMSYLLSGLPSTIGWRVMLAAGCVPAIILGCGVMFMPESPRWLVMQNRVGEAEEVLLKTSSDKQEAGQRLADIISAASRDNQKELPLQQLKQSHGEGVWRELLYPVPSVRRMLVVVLGVQFFQQASGIDALVYYSPSVFKQAGITSKTGLLGATVAVGFTKTLAVLVAAFWLDRMGRRPLLLVSGVGMSVFLGAIAIGFVFFDLDASQLKAAASTSSRTAVASTFAAICLYMVFFSIGFGPVSWVLTSEVFPLRLRAQAVSLAVAVGRVVSGLVTLTFLTISEAITVAGMFFIFSCVSALAVAFVYVFVPETKGKSLEEVSRMFEQQHEVHEIELGEASPEAAVLHAEEEGHEDEDGFAAEVPAYDRSALLARVKMIAKQQQQQRGLLESDSSGSLQH